MTSQASPTQSLRTFLGLVGAFRPTQTKMRPGSSFSTTVNEYSFNEHRPHTEAW